MGSAFTFGEVADPTPGVPPLQAGSSRKLVIRMRADDFIAGNLIHKSIWDYVHIEVFECFGAVMAILKHENFALLHRVLVHMRKSK